VMAITKKRFWAGARRQDRVDVAAGRACELPTLPTRHLVEMRQVFMAGPDDELVERRGPVTHNGRGAVTHNGRIKNQGENARFDARERHL